MNEKGIVVRAEEQLPASFYGLAANGAYEALHNWLEGVERAGMKCKGGEQIVEQVQVAMRLLSGLIVMVGWKEMALKDGRIGEGDSGEVIGMLGMIARDAELLGFSWERMEVY